MASFNQVTLVGNLTRDVDLKHTQGGTAVATLGLAINERRKQGDNWIDETVFVDVTLWGRTAEVAGEYLAKGSPVLISGRLRFEQWEKDGQKRSKLSVTGDKLQMLGSRRGDETSQVRDDIQDDGGADAERRHKAKAAQPADEDVPF